MNWTCKKSVLLIYILMVILLCPACDKDMPTVQNIAGEQENASAKPQEIVISHSQNENTPEDIAARAMQKKLQELLGDQVKVILYADYQMGSAQEQIEAMQFGRVHITIQPVSAAASFVDDIKVFLLPYLFSSNADDVIAVLDGPLGQEAVNRINMEQNESDFSCLGLWFGGYKLFTFHGEDNKNIHSPADFQGLSIAVPDNALLKSQYQHWGAKSIATDVIALYSSFAQCIADGGEATVSQIASNYLYEVQHNIVQAYHSTEIYVILANAVWFASLPADIQTAIMDAESYAQKILYDTLDDKEAVHLKTICQTEGMQYYVLDEKAQKIFRESVQPLYVEQLSGNAWQMDYVERIQEYFI